MMIEPISLQPIPYQGSKRALAPRICGLFPPSIKTLYEPFAGSAAVTVYAASHNLADRFVIGDSYIPLVDLWEMLIEHPTELSDRYAEVWQAQFAVGPSHFNEVRARYNDKRDPVLLLYLIARCVKNAVRFGKTGTFTQSHDKRRTGMKPDKVTRTAHAVSRLLKGRTSLYRGDFRDCILDASPEDLVYMDPPYAGTTYGRDKRYANGLERNPLIDGLHDLVQRRVPYILSYDGQLGEKVYAAPLPSSIEADHLQLHAGRSSQATILGRDDVTIESLYVSRSLNAAHADVFERQPAQARLFG